MPEQGRALVRGTADMYAGMSEVFRERNDLEGARRLLLESEELGEYAAMPQHPYRWRVAMARLCHAEGDAEGALALLQEAKRVYVADFFPDVRPLAALQARGWIAMGRLREARGWAREAGLAAEDELSYVREFEHITLARLLLATANSDTQAAKPRAQALGLLGRLREAAETGARTGSLIEILILKAIAAADAGDSPSALAALAQALTAAEPEGYARLFLDEGQAMTVLLREASQHGITTGYITELLGRRGTPIGRSRQNTWPPRTAQRPRARSPPPARFRAERARNSQPVCRLGQHPAHAHQAHLQQARRQHPPGRGPSRHPARPALTLSRPPASTTTWRAAPAPPAAVPTRLTRPNHHPKITSHGDVRSPHRFLTCRTHRRTPRPAPEQRSHT